MEDLNNVIILFQNNLDYNTLYIVITLNTNYIMDTFYIGVMINFYDNYLQYSENNKNNKFNI